MEFILKKVIFKKIIQKYIKKPLEIYPADNGQLGYTNGEGIFIAEDHEYFESLTEEEIFFFQLGILAHELLHILYSDFSILEKAYDNLSSKEYTVFQSILNCIEDPGIEYLAPHVYEGRIYRALRFSIEQCHKQSPNLDSIDSPFNQFIGALIQLGDLGFLKEQFTFPDAANIFTKSAPVVIKAVEDKDVNSRKKAAYKVFQISKPLWEKENIPENNYQDGKNPAGNQPRKSKSAKTESKEAMNQVVQALEQMQEALSSDSDIMKQVNDSFIMSDNLQKEKTELSEEDQNWIKTMEQTLKRQINKQKVNQKEEKEEKIDRSIQPTFVAMEGTKVYNHEVAKQSKEKENKYDKIVSRLNPQIQSFSKSLLKIFQNDKSKKVHSKKGTINIERYYSPRKTPRVFDKKRKPEQIKDTAIVLLIDESGSMNGTINGVSKKNIVRDIAIGMAESFSKLNISYYVIGYSAFGSQVDHNHYIKWRNLPTERKKLVSISSISGNYDAVSVNYAKELLKKRKAAHKLLIVMTDGIPSIGKPKEVWEQVKTCRGDGIQVLGVAIGEDDTQDIKDMYGQFFYHVDKASSFSEIANILTKLIKKG